MAIALVTERRTSADLVFEHLYERIMSLELMPGAKMSEAEVAEQFGVSRQPVRDAFNRLGNMELLLIQPQKATLVQKFSLKRINAARFVRLAIELEVGRIAARNWSEAHRPAFAANLAAQEQAVTDSDAKAFHNLDEDFHRLVADVADAPFAFDLILQKKSMVDRICVLSLKQADEMADLVRDHRTIFEAIASGDPDGLETAIRTHLSRIQKTIDAVCAAHAEYFEA